MILRNPHDALESSGSLGSCGVPLVRRILRNPYEALKFLQALKILMILRNPYNLQESLGSLGILQVRRNLRNPQNPQESLRNPGSSRIPQVLKSLCSSGIPQGSLRMTPTIPQSLKNALGIRKQSLRDPLSKLAKTIGRKLLPKHEL